MNQNQNQENFHKLSYCYWHVCWVEKKITFLKKVLLPLFKETFIWAHLFAFRDHTYMRSFESFVFFLFMRLFNSLSLHGAHYHTHTHTHTHARTYARTHARTHTIDSVSGIHSDLWKSCCFYRSGKLKIVLMNKILLQEKFDT